ncbi:MAG: thioredoxin family protein [Planctomycetota bacterium]|nr:thioredoxin family protein [Planctomycetota bacterium]MDA1114224.1 thioredoxin family protein [Planctomycetota bacterium]
MYEKDAFSAKVTEDYVLVVLDFPSGDEAKALVPNPERNEELKNKYGITGFPTVLLMTPEGEVFGRSGYTGATPEDYLADVVTKRAEGKAALAKIKQINAEFEAAEDKMAVVKKVAGLLANLDGAPGAETLSAILRKGFELDPENKSGFKLDALKALLKSGQSNDADLAMAVEMDPANEHGLMEAVVANAMDGLASLDDLEGFLTSADALFATGKVHNKELVSTFWLNSAFFCHKYLEKPAEAKVWAQRAKDLGVDEEGMEIINEILGSADPA